MLYLKYYNLLKRLQQGRQRGVCGRQVARKGQVGLPWT